MKVANEISRDEALTKLSAKGEPYELIDGKVLGDRVEYFKTVQKR